MCPYSQIIPSPSGRAELHLLVFILCLISEVQIMIEDDTAIVEVCRQILDFMYASWYLPHRMFIF